MNKKEFLLRVNNGILRGSTSKISKMLGVTLPTVSGWLSGSYSPSEQNIAKMAGLFGMTPAEVRAVFDGIRQEKISNEFVPASAVRGVPLTPNNTITLPILADVPAGLPEFSDRDVEQFVDFPRFLFPGADYIIRCIGDSLEPKIHLGDYCVISKKKEAIYGRPMFVRTEDGVCMKIVKQVKGRTLLCSTNPKYKPFAPKELKIYGLIIGHWSRDDREVWEG